jgi:serine protease inhibitor
MSYELRTTNEPTSARTAAAVVALGVALALAVAACSDGTGVAPLTRLPRDLTIHEMRVIDGSNAFAFDLLRELVAESDSPNVFISPLSASMALAMAMNGADGETWTQMRDVLGFGGLEEAEINRAYRDLIALLLGLDAKVQVGIANSVWAAQQGPPLLPDYQDRVRAHFDAEVRTVDFTDPATRTAMNDWVASATNGRIEEMIEVLDPSVLVFLLNAVYFKGDWRDRFPRSRTAPAPFTLADGTIRQVDMMDGDVGYRYVVGHGPGAISGVELPYSRDAFAAVAILPPAGMPMAEFVAGLDPVAWADWMAGFDDQADREDTRVPGILVRLPKLEIEWADSLIAPLQRLGMVDAFDDLRADFRRMTGQPGLFIGEAFQKTFLKVDEEGTEAAAATGIAMPSSVPPSVTFDRPFLFAIRERFSGTILFIGVIGDPGA